MSISEELLEKVDGEMEEGAEIFDDLSLKLRNEFKSFQLDAIPENLVSVRKELMNSLTNSELTGYLQKDSKRLLILRNHLTSKTDL